MIATSSGGAEHALNMVQLALESALRVPEGQITPATETQLANALHILRSTKCEASTLQKVEQVAVWIRFMMEAKRDGLPNLYASRLLRLRRMVMTPAT